MCINNQADETAKLVSLLYIGTRVMYIRDTSNNHRGIGRRAPDEQGRKLLQYLDVYNIV